VSEKADRTQFKSTVGKKEKRSIRAREKGRMSAWFGMGMFGVVGWSVMIPTVIGIAVGVWLDSRFDDRILWTLMLALIGLFIGCLNAWFWITNERKKIERERMNE